jgi:hypothetical protein
VEVVLVERGVECRKSYSIGVVPKNEAFPVSGEDQHAASVIYKRQLSRRFPMYSHRFTWAWLAGSVYFIGTKEEHAEVSSNLPLFWDEEALKELKEIEQNRRQ